MRRLSTAGPPAALNPEDDAMTASPGPENLPPQPSAEPAPVNHGWFKAVRGPEVLELIRANPLAYVLAAVIAHRGRYHEGFNRHNLKLGEALLGDFKNYGMSEQQYRTAKAQLAEWGFATFRATNKGTVGKLTDTRLFAIFRLAGNTQANRRATTSQRPANDRPTTNKEHSEEHNKERTKPGAQTGGAEGAPPSCAAGQNKGVVGSW